MEVITFFLAIISTNYISCTPAKTLTNILSHYDTLNIRDLTHNIVRRDASYSNPISNSDRNIDFTSHGKRFHMKLQTSRDIFASGFEAVSVDELGNETPVMINMDSYYKGYITEDASSRVIAHFEDNGLMTATIDTANETYYVEPMWRHVDNDPSHDMIIYTATNLNSNITNSGHVSTCGNKGTAEETVDENDSNGRSRRSAGSCKDLQGEDKSTCGLILVGDVHFYEKIGRKHEQTAIYYMLQVIQKVDGIYRGTCWNNVGKGIGVQVKKTMVHTSFTKASSKTAGYNKKKTPNWNVDKLLTEFSRSPWNEYCLAHLFTYQDFDYGVIGLAYVGSTRSRIGGICSPTARDRTSLRYHNSGLTTYVNWKRRLTTLEAQLVTTHEIGHNFGSNHDPKKCSRDGAGKFVMYATSVTGEKGNNAKFSVCSKDQVGAVLQRRRNLPKCFTKRSGAECGNGVVEGDEECDEGTSKNNKCCKDCRFTSGSTCTSSNSLCCKDCKPAPTTQVCRSKFQLDCKDETTCDGKKSVCPKAPPLNKGDCNRGFSKGECTNGNCTSICELNKKVDCRCAEGGDACKVCCKANTNYINNAPCVAHKPIHLENDGVECLAKDRSDGLCESGECKKLKRDVKENFVGIFKDFTLDKAVRWMENNIVLTILVFSLIPWIIAGIIVNQIDKNEDAKEKERMEQSNEFIKPRPSIKKRNAGARVASNVST